MESSIDRVFQDISNLLTPQIIISEGNLVFHTEWNNMNKFTTNILGTNIVNSMAGIMIQEIKPGFEIDQHVRKIPVLQHSQTILSNAVPETLPSLIISAKTETYFFQDAVFALPENVYDQYTKCLKVYYVWLIARISSSGGDAQKMPGFAGFASATGAKPERKSTIDYFNLIHQPIPEYAVIKRVTPTVRRSN